MSLVEDKILTWAEKEAEVGSLITAAEAAELIGINKKSLVNKISEGKYKGLYLIVGKEIEKIPGQREKYVFIKNELLKEFPPIISWENKEKELGCKLLTTKEAAPYFGLSELMLNRKILDGAFKGLYLKIGVDIKPPRERKATKIKYAFPEQGIVDLPTQENIEKKEGKLLLLSEAAPYFGLTEGHLFMLLRSGFFKELYLYVGLDGDVLPTGRYGGAKKYLFPLNRLENAKEHLEEIYKLENNPNIFLDYFFAQSRGITIEELLEEIETGVWDHAIVGKRTKLKYSNGRPDRTIYMFDRKKTLNSMKYNTMNQIGEILGISPSTLSNYADRGLLPRPKELEGTRFWDVELIKEALPEIQDELYSKRNDFKGQSSWDLLNDEQKTIINEFIKFKSINGKIVWEDREYYNEVYAKPEKSGETQKLKIARFLEKIISERSGIKTFKTDSSGEIKTRSLKEYAKSEKAKFDPNKLILDLSSHDLLHTSDVQSILIDDKDVNRYMEGYSPQSNWSASHIIKPFLYWLLMELEKKYPLWRVDSENQGKDYYNRRAKLLNAINAFPSQEPDERRKEKRLKVYLVRKQIVQIYQVLRNLEKLPKGTYERGMKYATMWMVGYFLGVRPQEIYELRIEHFNLDENCFIKKINKKGYGSAKFPRQIVKGKYSPSHPLYGTLIVPVLVNLLNEYIKLLYKYQKPGNGYLFRARLNRPEEKEVSNPFNWLVNYKKYFNKILTTKQIENLQFKNTRHSLNNTLDKTPVPTHLTSIKKRAAEIQMRHNIFMTKGTTGDTNYKDEISARDYFETIDWVLNFPWDEESLGKWEIDKGFAVSYTNDHDPEVLFNFDDDEDEEDDDETQNKNIEIVDDVDFIKIKPGFEFEDSVQKHAEKIVHEIEIKKIEKEKLDSNLQAEFIEVDAKLKMLRKTAAKKLGVTPDRRQQLIEESKKRLLQLDAMLG
jgi:integrase